MFRLFRRFTLARIESRYQFQPVRKIGGIKQFPTVLPGNIDKPEDPVSPGSSDTEIQKNQNENKKNKGHRFGYETCPCCKGKGIVECVSCNGYGRKYLGARKEYLCKSCNGRGSDLCQLCDGSGLLKSAENMYITF